MNDKVSPDEPLATCTEAEGATVDLPAGLGFFNVGQVLGERYEILEMLGRGGMGEVWRAFDLKLRVEVGLKALRDDLFQSERRLELLRQEVRAAREVVSPNVCRIFDLIEIDGRELVSMEYVDGATLLGVLQERGPLELKEAQDIASQFLAGLEAIHKAGLVHRDVKPENIMLTRAGRVVVMDFGLARGPESGAGSVSGTPAYMAPEHAAGADVDARADVYSAGVVLAEMVSPEGIKSYQSRQSLWEDVRSEPAKIPDSPWAPVIKRAVARDRERRQNSAHTLIRELEDVTLRVEGADDLNPYPGLASFTEQDAEYFFGREAEVEQMWRKLEGPPRMLGIMGPSGAGKTSFIRAGLIPKAPRDWAIIRCTPGNAAVASLRGALTSVLPHGSENLTRLLTDPDNPDVIVDTMAAAQSDHSGALLIVDQFEELFTLSSKEDQRSFASLLGRLPLESDVHVILAMRDDFAADCNSHRSLQPIFHELTVLNPPTGGNLRRALVQPATKCGYRFEDDDLVDEMLAEVEGERGALPLLAFAMSRLWEKRDRDPGFLTRQAYHDIGGVGGALARHAEATVDQIGVECIPIVRELFRNLVTAEGTRAVREWNELVSVFDKGNDSNTEQGPGAIGRHARMPAATKSGETVAASFQLASPLADRGAAEEVLRELIDARLLTSYEVREDEHKPIRRVEIIHESLLANWPRLVRWQTQDQEGAQLRDELRQAARAWDDHDRHVDRLWTGTAFREYQLWLERYPGGLTEVEEAFALAMAAFAGRRRRKRRLIVAAVMAALVAGLVVVGSFWQRSVRETRRAEAANLLSLGQLELESYPSATVAYAIASLEQSDGLNARRMALKALWKGPTALIATDNLDWGNRFSPDGRWLVQAQLRPKNGESHLSVFHEDGTRNYLADEHSGAPYIGVTPITEAGHFVSWAPESETSIKSVVWSVFNNQPLASISFESTRVHWGAVVDSGRQRAVFLLRDDDRLSVDALFFDGTYEHLGSLDFVVERDESRRWSTVAELDPRAGEWLGVVNGSDVYVVDVGEHKLGPPRLLGRHDGVVPWLACDPLGRFIATASEDSEFRFWDLSGTSPPTTFQGPKGSSLFKFAPDGSLFEAGSSEADYRLVWVWALSGSSPRLIRRFDFGPPQEGDPWWGTTGRQLARGGRDLKFRVSSIDAPHDADPMVLSRGDIQEINGTVSINPQGGWLTTGDNAGLAFWPLSERFPIVIRKHEGNIVGLTFAPDGGWLASSSQDGTVRLWPLEGNPPPPGRTLLSESDDWIFGLAASPDGEQILSGTQQGGVHLLHTDRETVRILEGFDQQVMGVAFSPDGKLAAAVGGQFITTDRAIRIWSVASGEEVAVLEISEQPIPHCLQFISNNLLLSISESGLWQWDTTTGDHKLLYEGTNGAVFLFAASADGGRVVVVEKNVEKAGGSLVLLELDSGAVTPLGGFGDEIAGVALDAMGTIIATGDVDGEVRVGLLAGGETHLLIGHQGSVWTLAIDPKGRWIASGGTDFTVRLWPMPDLTKPPLHTLPREELIAKLKTLTNLRVVRDSESATGWKLTHDPFPGWETVPTW